MAITNPQTPEEWIQYRQEQRAASQNQPKTPNQAQQTQMSTQLANTGTIDPRYAQEFGYSASSPGYNYASAPKNLGVDANGRPITEQDWINSGGLNTALGRADGFNATKMSDGRYLDTTNLTPQQAYAATLMDEVQSGKRDRAGAIAVLSGMGLDMYGNKLPEGVSVNNAAQNKSPTASAAGGATSAAMGAGASGGTAGLAGGAGVTGIGVGSVGGGGLGDFIANQTNLINSMYANQQQSVLQGIRNQRDTALAGLAGVDEVANQQATNQRGQVAAADVQAAQRLREAMSSMGLLNSGDNLTALSNQNVNRQSAMGEVNQNLQNNLASTAAQRNQINNAAAANDAAAIADLQARQLQDMINLGTQANEIQYRDDQAAWNRAMDQANMTGRFLTPQDQQVQGMLNQLTSLGQAWQGGNAEQRAQYSAQANAIRSQLASMGVDPALYDPSMSTAQRQQAGSGLGQQTLQAQQIAYQQARDQIGDQLAKQQFDEDVRRFDLNYALDRQVQMGNLSLNQAQLALSRANAAADNARQASAANFNQLMDVWQATGVAPSGLQSYGIQPGQVYTPGSGGGAAGGSVTKAPAISTVMNNVNKLFGTYNTNTRKYDVTDPNAVAYIASQFPDDPQYDTVIDQIIASYGLNAPSASTGGGPVSGMVEMR